MLEFVDGAIVLRSIREQMFSAVARDNFLFLYQFTCASSMALTLYRYSSHASSKAAHFTVGGQRTGRQPEKGKIRVSERQLLSCPRPALSGVAWRLVSDPWIEGALT